MTGCRRLTLRFAVILAALSAVISAQPLVAQARAWTGVAAGSNDELYVRALQLLGALPASAWVSRPLATAVLDSARRVVSVGHPWKTRFGTDTTRPVAQFVWRGASLDGSWNSAFAWGGNDGARWQGKGVNTLITSGFLFRWRALSLRTEPALVYARNLPFDVLPVAAVGDISPFVDRMRPRTIDLPDRFGDRALQRLDAGESEIRVEGHGVAAALSNRSLFFGPAFRNPLILGANAPGFAHLSVGTASGVRTPVGVFNATVVYARLAQSGWAPDTGEAARLAAATVVSWRPPSGTGVELGFIRFYHRQWPSGGIRPAHLLLPFGSLFKDREVAGNAPADNQLLSLFARGVSKQTGLEVFAEFVRNDRSANQRDLLAEPEHNSAWSAGVLKVVGSRSNAHFWTTRAEYLNGRITSLQRFRPQATLYEHFAITQGHTNRGQLLGSPLLERTGGFEIAVDRWDTRGRVGGMVQQRAMPLIGIEGVPDGAARSQWALDLNGDLFDGTRAYGWRAGVVWDLNRTSGRDEKNAFVGIRMKFGG